MIVYKQWRKSWFSGLKHYEYEGWFLLGFIPLYVRRHGSHA